MESAGGVGSGAVHESFAEVKVTWIESRDLREIYENGLASQIATNIGSGLFSSVGVITLGDYTIPNSVTGIVILGLGYLWWIINVSLKQHSLIKNARPGKSRIFGELTTTELVGSDTA